jgi:hypothetical protein
MDYNLSYPDVTHRKNLLPYGLHRGSVVAFRIHQFGDVRTGIIVMESPGWLLAAVNLYEEGQIWYSDQLPENIELYEANEEETLWGLACYLDYYYKNEYRGVNPLIAFIDHECPKNASNSGGAEALCEDMLTRVPDLFDKAEWTGIKNTLSQLIMQTSGLQYDRFRIEYYCFLIGVLMIAEHEEDAFRRKEMIQLFRKNWGQLSWMYGIGIGRVLGSALHNFTAVINQTTQNRRKHYLHLYLPLAEYFIDKICKYNDDKREKLQEAIRKAKVIEAREKQEPDLDELYGILFPKHSLEALSANRPAATIAEMRQEMAAQEQKISSLESRLSASISDFNRRYEALLHSFEALVKVSITFDEIKKGLKELSRTTAEGVLEKLSITLADNKRFMDELPKLREFVKENDKPSEVHNHFEKESGCQVFNGPVSGQFNKK